MNSASSERRESVLFDEDDLITQSKIIPNSSDSSEHNNIVDGKIGLTEMKIQCPEKITVGHLNVNSKGIILMHFLSLLILIWTYYLFQRLN